MNSTSDQVFVLEVDHTYSNAVLATNTISVVASSIAIVTYFILRAKNPRLMSRTSLKLSAAMACTDLVLHSVNLAGYGRLPSGFLCAFIGGWLYAMPSMLSVFYASAIALNTQLVFVHKRRLKDQRQILFLVVPPVVAFLIATPTLIAGFYGFDQRFEYCWYETRNIPDKTVLLRVILTYYIWLFIPVFYLLVAVVLITYSLFGPQSLLSGMGAKRYLAKQPSQGHSMSSTNITATLSATLARRDRARRALTTRVLGYIIVPIICMIPAVPVDILLRTRPDASILPTLTLVTAITAGLMGTFNAILLSFDPSVIAVVSGRGAHKRREARRQGWFPNLKARVLGGDIEMGSSKTGGTTMESHISFYPFDTTNRSCLEIRQQSVPGGTSDSGEGNATSQNTSELADTYHGL